MRAAHREDGAEVATGEIGELLVAGESGAEGYWNRRDKSRATFEGIWTRTGDKYERRADGRYIYCGRTDDLFKVSGIWVSPFEVEQSITAHDAVVEAAVVAAAVNLSQNNPFVSVLPGAALGKVFEGMAHGYHRVTIENPDSGEIIGLITQSQMIRMLAGHRPLLGAFADKPLGEIFKLGPKFKVG